jgi:DUF4097 and DUF4098 domain-containing protein YvlB
VRTETFQTPGPTALAVRIPAGQISIEAREGDRTEVRLQVVKGDPEAERDATIELHDRGGRFDVVVESPKRRFNFSREQYAVEIVVPEGTDVESRTGSADTRGRGRFRHVDVATGSGEIEFDEIQGDLKVKGASGDVTAESVGGEASVATASGDVEIGALAGRGRIRSASGDVEIREAANALSIHTASGDQTIGSAASGELTLRSASGDVHVGIRRGSRVFIDARSASGDMGSDLELADDAPAGDGPLVEVNATTASGDVRIVRA